jgi:Tfp pilus assembly PilM family ATPase
MKRIFNQLVREGMPRSAIGLDIGMSAIKAVELQTTDNQTRLIAYGSVSTPSEFFAKINTGYLTILNNSIQQLLDQPIYGKFNVQKVHISLPIEYTDSGDTLTSPGDRFRTSLAQINLELQSLQYQHLALQKSCSSNSGKITAIVDFGSETTRGYMFGLLEQPMQLYQFSSQKVSESLAEKINITPAASAKLLQTVGIAGNELGGKIRSILMPEIDLLKAEVLQNYMSFKDAYAGPLGLKLEDLILTGKFANTPGLSEYLEKDMPFTVKVANPWQNLSLYPLKPMPKSRNTEYALAIGLAMH